MQQRIEYLDKPTENRIKLYYMCQSFMQYLINHKVYSSFDHTNSDKPLFIPKWMKSNATISDENDFSRGYDNGKVKLQRRSLMTTLKQGYSDCYLQGFYLSYYQKLRHCFSEKGELISHFYNSIFLNEDRLITIFTMLNQQQSEIFIESKNTASRLGTAFANAAQQSLEALQKESLWFSAPTISLARESDERQLQKTVYLQSCFPVIDIRQTEGLDQLYGDCRKRKARAQPDKTEKELAQASPKRCKDFSFWETSFDPTYLDLYGLTSEMASRQENESDVTDNDKEDIIAQSISTSLTTEPELQTGNRKHAPWTTIDSNTTAPLSPYSIWYPLKEKYNSSIYQQCIEALRNNTPTVFIFLVSNYAIKPEEKNKIVELLDEKIDKEKHSSPVYILPSHLHEIELMKRKEQHQPSSQETKYTEMRKWFIENCKTDIIENQPQKKPT